MIPPGIRCWMQFPEDIPYVECVAYEKRHGKLCDGVPVEKYNPELGRHYEVCAQCGATPPESAS